MVAFKHPNSPDSFTMALTHKAPLRCAAKMENGWAKHLETFYPANFNYFSCCMWDQILFHLKKHICRIGIRQATTILLFLTFGTKKMEVKRNYRHTTSWVMKANLPLHEARNPEIQGGNPWWSVICVVPLHPLNHCHCSTGISHSYTNKLFVKKYV